jgi:hypothetical protein
MNTFASQTFTESANLHNAKFLPFDESLEGSGRWIQELRGKGQHAVPVITGLPVDNVENTKSDLYCW